MSSDDPLSTFGLPLLHLNPLERSETVSPKAAGAKSMGFWAATKSAAKSPFSAHDGHDSICRICYDSEAFDNPGEKLISPCDCRGSMAFIHKSCLNAWRQVRKGNYNECEHCLAPYRVKPKFYASLVTNETLRHSVGAFTFLLLLQFLGMVVRAPIDTSDIHPFVECLARLSAGAFVASLVGGVIAAIDLKSVILRPGYASTAIGPKDVSSAPGLLDTLRAAAQFGSGFTPMFAGQAVLAAMFVGFARTGAAVCDFVGKTFEAWRADVEDELEDY